MKTIRIFISSPCDVAVERDKARKVVENLQKRYAGRLRLETVLWEDLPLGAVDSFQGGIDVVLKGENAIDIAVFILWSRLGSPLGATIRRSDGSAYRSGTEREFDLMLAARERSPDHRPEILVYVRQDDSRFRAALMDKPTDVFNEMLRQHQLADQFIREQFHDADTGANLRAYHTFAEPNSFAARLKIHLRNLMDAIAMDGGFDAVAWEGSPYRGLEVFRSEHAPIFFGRDEEVCEALERLRAQAEAGCAFLLLVGASGSGKSSLARAGILPALASDNPDESVAEWRTAAFTPGACADGLCRELARILLDRLPDLRGDERSLDDLEQALHDGQGKALSLLLRRACAGTEGRGSVRLVLLIDQLEELFTLSAITEAETTAFLAALQTLAVSGCVWVLATVRSDFYGRCQQFPALMSMKGGRGQMDLLPPKPSDIHRIITGPAVLAGVGFEKNASGESLDQRLLNDAVAHPEALPLLEFALAQLYEARTAEGLLTFAAYDALNGVEGAIGRHAEAVFAAQPETVRDAFAPVFGALVSLDESSETCPVRRRVPMEALASTPERRILVEALLAARLLSSDRGEVFVAHEALLRRWERAVQWIAANRDRLRVRDRLAARRVEGSPLAENDPLTGLARYHLAHTPDAFEPELRRFIEDQLAALDNNRKRRNRIRQAVVAGLAALAAFALFQWQKAEKARAYADTARGQAEELINFMTFDLRDKLEPVGRLDLMAGVNQAVESYHQKRAAAEAKAGRRMGSEELRRRSASLYNQGDSLRDRGDLAGALKAYRESLAVAERLAASAPSNAGWQRDLSVNQNKIGDVLIRTQGGLAGAQKAYREAYEVMERLAASDPANRIWQSNLSESQAKIGDVLFAQGDLAGALKAFRESLAAVERLSALDPSNAVWQCNLSMAQTSIGNVLAVQGDLAGSLKAYKESLAAADRLASSDPSNAEWKFNLSRVKNMIGMALGWKKDFAGALKAYRESLAVAENLVALDPSNAVWWNHWSACQRDIGDMLLAQGDLAGALKAFRESLAAVERLSALDPPNALWQRNLSVNQGNIGSVLEKQGDLAGAQRAYRESLAGIERLVASNTSVVAWQSDLVNSCENLGRIMKKQGQYAEARDSFVKELGFMELQYAKLTMDEALAFPINGVSQVVECGAELKNSMAARGGLINVLLKLVECDLALKDYASALSHQMRLVALRRGTDDKGSLAAALRTHGDIAAQLGRYAEAFSAVTESLDVTVKLSDVNQQWLCDANGSLCWYATLAGKQAEALAAGEKAVFLLKDDKPCPARMNLAHAYLFNGQFEKAKAIYSKYLGTSFDDGRKWNDEMRNDFATLREAGRDHPDMKKIEALLPDMDSAQ